MSVVSSRFVTEEEYLALEAVAEAKHEYFAGQIFDRALGDPEHSLISSNIACTIGMALKGGPWRIYDPNLRIRVEATGFNTYPDVTVVCGEPIRTDQRPPAISNPALLVEVLSRSTQDRDRGEKWLNYQLIESLTDYLLVWQDCPRVEHYSRQQGGEWSYRLIEGIENAATIVSLGVAIPLTEIYGGVDFPDPSLGS